MVFDVMLFGRPKKTKASSHALVKKAGLPVQF